MLALDASAIICLIEGIEPSRSAIALRLRELGPPWFVSTIAVTECLTRAKSRKMPSMRGAFETFFTAAEVLVVPVSFTIAIKAAELRSTFNLKSPDAIHLATAMEYFAELFITTDSDFTKCSGRVGLEIQVVTRPPRIV